MWPFKKKVQQNPAPVTFATVICIPGVWSDWNEFILSIVAATNGAYLAAGSVLMDVNNQKHYTVDFCLPDKNMKDAFMYAGKVTRVTDQFLEAIGMHKSVVYISGTTGNLIDAAHIAKAAEAVLKAGGIGVKVETAGKAFEKDIWFELLHTYEQPALYEMFVVDSIADRNGTVYSCGMQNLGYRDSIVSGEEFQSAVELIRTFAYYQIIDKPVISEGETFSKDAVSARYKIIDEPDQPNKGIELFDNPFGVWRLVKI